MKNYKTDIISTAMRDLGLTFKKLSKIAGVSQTRLVLATQDIVKNNITPQTIIKICPHIGFKEDEFWMIYAGTRDYISLEEFERYKSESKKKINELKEEVYKLKDEKMELMEKLIE